MNYNEAIKVLGAKQGDTLDEITKFYRSKVKQSHPDQGGNTQWFVDVRAAFKIILAQYKYNHKSQNEDTGEWEENETNLTQELQEKLTEVLEKLNSEEIEINILGAWIWLSGNTYQNKNDIKELGFKFSKNKVSWYWYHGEYKKRNRKKYSLKDIEEIHGKVPIEKKRKKLLVGKT